MCANEPQQLLKTSKFYSRCKKFDIKKNLTGWVPPPLVARRLKQLEVNAKGKAFAKQISGQRIYIKIVEVSEVAHSSLPQIQPVIGIVFVLHF